MENITLEMIYTKLQEVLDRLDELEEVIRDLDVPLNSMTTLEFD